MDASSSATPQPLPRLRVLRGPHSGRLDAANNSTASSLAGPSRLPDLSQLADLSLADVRAPLELTDEGEELDQHPTPRVNVVPLSAPAVSSSDKLADRLRALITLVPNGSASRSTPTLPRPPSPTFFESDFEGDSAAPTPSFAHESLRGIFSKALRDPGDTPQKGRERRNSDGGVRELDPNPAASRKWTDIKGKRRSLSDEEGESPTKSGGRNSPHDMSSQRTILRHSRETNAVEFPLKSISADDSDDVEGSPAPNRISPPNATSTPLHSLRLSQNSSFPRHSNLLDQDSEMQRAFGQLDSFDDPSAYQQKSRETDVRPTTQDGVSPVGPESLETLAHTPRLPRKNPDSHDFSSRSTFTPPLPKPNLRNDNQDHREEANNSAIKRRISFHRSTAPHLKHKNSLQFSDRSSSMSSSDYAERIRELEQERYHEREREWNKPRIKTTRPGGNPHTHSPTSAHRSRTSSVSNLEPPRPGSALSDASMDSIDVPGTRSRTMSGLGDRPRTQSLLGTTRPSSALSNKSSTVQDFPQGLRRHHSLTSRADSPSGSSVDSSNRSEEVQAEVVHERERNWNAPRPKWHRRSLTSTPIRPVSPAPSKQPSSPHSPSQRHHQTDTLTSPTALRDTSNTSRSDPQSERSSKSEGVPSSPPPAELRRGSPLPSLRYPQTSRPSTVTASTPARPRSPLSRPTSHGKSLLPVPSNRSHRSKTESHKPTSNTQVENEPNIPPALPGASFPHMTQSGSLSQQSMDLTEAYNRIPIPNNDTMHTTSLLGPSDSRAVVESDPDADMLAQERTPTLQTIKPPPEGNYPQASSYSSETHENVSPSQEAVIPSQDFQPTDPDQSSVHSFLMTPPRSRQSSLSGLKPEFQTPPPPTGLPDLPRPPVSVSEDETESDSHLGAIPVNEAVDGKGNLTAFQTPKPPGAWFATPAPPSRKPVVQEDSRDAFTDSADDDPPDNTPYLPSQFPQTPAPPGGWMNTPAVHRNTPIGPEGQESILNEGGLNTPVTSLGRNSALPFKTPAPPGAWTSIPSARKSILKVRFETGMDSQASGSPDTQENTVSQPQTNGSSGIIPEPRASTPEPAMPATPPSRSPRKHRRSPGIRMVDAYGNERREEKVRKRDASSPTPQTPRNRGPIRIVDAMGREVKEEEQPSEAVSENTDLSSQEAPMNQTEALQRVRQGILELAKGIESLDLTSPTQGADNTRIKELDEVSRASRQSRERLARDMHTAETELRRRTQQKVVSTNRWSGQVTKNPWFLFLVGTLQLVLVFIMYRASVLRARKMFLTNYYDPFNPDLFLYTTRPDTQYATQMTSWSLVTQAARNGNLTAFTGAFRENLSSLIKGWHQQLWDVWGDDPSRPMGVWPPT